MSLEQTEKECGANATAPRVSLADIEGAIACRYDVNAHDVLSLKGTTLGLELPTEADSLAVLSVCFLVMRNGFTIIGKSAPASAANFNVELGRKLAYEDAIRQLWPLMGFSLRDHLATTPMTQSISPA